MKNNPIFQVLVVSNPTILAAANDPWDLAVGQLGVFNAETNLSFDPTSTVPDKFYFAVGTDPEGTGSIADIKKSAGDYIRKAKVNTVSAKHPEVGSDQVTTIALTGTTPNAGADYTIRTDFMSGQIMQMHGFNSPIKSFTVTVPASDWTLKQLIDNLVLEINKDDEGLIVASNSADVSLVLTFGGETKAKTVGGINPRYSFLRQFSCNVACTNGFEDHPGTVAISTVDPVYEEGSGYDIQQLEYIAGGFEGKPGIYRDSNLNGLFATGNFEPLAVKTASYWQSWFNYELLSNSGGMLNYSNQVETLIAIPNYTEPGSNVDFSSVLNAIATLGGTLVGLDQTSGTIEAYASEA